MRTRATEADCSCTPRPAGLYSALEQLAGAPWAPDPPRGRGVSSDVARLE